MPRTTTEIIKFAVEALDAADGYLKHGAPEMAEGHMGMASGALHALTPTERAKHAHLDARRERLFRRWSEMMDEKEKRVAKTRRTRK